MNIIPDIIIKAKERDATVQLDLGKVYYKTTLIKNIDTTVFEWIHHSADQGNMEAQFQLGDMYALGFGTEKSFSGSYEWYTRAAIQGYNRALIRIHNLYQEDIKIHCRGTLNSFEAHSHHGFRELFEWRQNEYEAVLNHAIDYYTDLFKRYQSSDQNKIYVQLNLAFLYQHGYGTKKCTRWAFEYYTLAAEQGNADAQYNLGYLYQQHTRKKFNYRHAFKWYTKSAQGGNIAAQRCLAYFYLKGLAIDIDCEKAIFWYTKAAEAGDSLSQVTLGMLYRRGDYVVQNFSFAARWYTLAARQGSIVAQNCLSQLYHRNMSTDVESLDYCKKGSTENRLCSKLSVDISKFGDARLSKLAKHALMGDGPAMFEIGTIYYYGKNKFPLEKETGVKWIKHAAKRKHKDAQFMMANLYMEGDTIEQDYHKSYIWYKTIAKQRDPHAQFQVGIRYKNGFGVRKDPLESSKWFMWAADQGNSDAQFHLGMLRLYGIKIRKDKAEAEAYFYASVLDKNVQVCYELGKMYFYGTDGLQEHLGAGLRLLEFAARHDHSDAQVFLGNIYSHRKGVQQNISKSIIYYTMAANAGSGAAQYKLAIAYLHGDDIHRDYTKAYNLFKQAQDKYLENAISLFQTPIVYDPNIKDYSKVINMFIEVTEKRIDNLAYHIGFLYQHGVSFFNHQYVDINYAKAEAWYLLASDSGDSRADYRLGMMYECGKGVEKNMTTAVHHYSNATKKENSDAIYRLAYLYLNGQGVVQNLLQAFHLYTKASVLGYKEAIKALTVFEYNKNTMYNSNNSDEYLEAPVYRNKLINMLERVTEEDYTRLQYQLGVMYERNNDNSNAFKWLSLAVDLGITDAYYRLGVLYEEGKGVEQSYTVAADMYQKATEKDHEDACYRLGQLYQYGDGVELDYLKAYNFYKKAAGMDHQMATRILNITLEKKTRPNDSIKENVFDILSKEYQDSLTMCKYVAECGDVDVQFKVGFVYEYKYMEPDYDEALKWYSVAAKNSHKEALYHLGLFYEIGLVVIQDYKKAIQLYEQAYRLGSNGAIHRLGTIYHYGKGVRIDPIKAIECYALSAKLGNPSHQCEFGRLHEEGEMVQKNPLETLKWYTKAYTQGYNNIGSRLYSLYDEEPYEHFFFEKLFRNLSIASCNYFGLNEHYSYKDFEDINNRLGFMCFFGIGTDKNLSQSLEFFLKEYSDKTRTSIVDFGFFQYSGFTLSQKLGILEEFEKDEKCVDQLGPQNLYILGMSFCNDIVETQDMIEDSKKNGYISTHKQNRNNASRNTLIEKDNIKASNYFKWAAEKNHPEALFQLGIMYHCGYGVEKDSGQGNRYFGLIPPSNINLMERIAILYHTHKEIQNFSKAFEYYIHIEKMITTIFDISTNEQRRINKLVQIGLGLLYEYGNGVEQDHRIALDYYITAADQNSKIGLFRQTLMYYYGQGVPVDHKKALVFFKRITRGFYFYTDKNPYVYDQIKLPTRDDGSQKKLVYCTKTEKEIQGESYYYLGMIYTLGQGVLMDQDRAQEYFRNALYCGCQYAENEMKD